MKLACDIDIRRPTGFTLACRIECNAESLGIVGPSGSGKSTLLAAIAGIEAANKIVIDGDELTHVPMHRRRVGYVTQDASLFPHLSVRRNLIYSPQASSIDDVARALHIEHLLDRMPRNLSGGERRRAALARAIAAKPRVLLLDEPFAGLDEALRRDAMSLLQNVRSTFNIPMILVSHMAEEIIGLTDWAVRLEDGVVRASGPSASVLRGGETHIDNYLVGELIGPGRLIVEGVELSVAFANGSPAPGAQTRPANSGRVRAACFARDIMLAKRRPEEISARNVLPVTIIEAMPAGDAVLLTVSPPRLRVIVTPQAATVLDLTPGRPAFAIIKATSIAYLGPA